MLPRGWARTHSTLAVPRCFYIYARYALSLAQPASPVGPCHSTQQLSGACTVTKGEESNSSACCTSTASLHKAMAKPFVDRVQLATSLGTFTRTRLLHVRTSRRSRLLVRQFSPNAAPCFKFLHFVDFPSLVHGRTLEALPVARKSQRRDCGLPDFQCVSISG